MTAPVRFMRVADWLAWHQSTHPRAIDLGLERVSSVLARTGWRPPAQPVVTIGGTNGKGSCTALLEAMLRGGGYRVGSFTSPHFTDYRERIRIDGEWVSEASLVSAFERIADACLDDSLTYFEHNALAALLVFETARPDAILLEVGMGGRLDAVNVVDADVAIVVSVGLDHMDYLGPDIESIGREKAGIFRAGRPAICGMPDPPRSVVDGAAAAGATLRLRGRDFHERVHADGTWDYVDRLGGFDALPAPALEGVVQYGNAATALAALRHLQGALPVTREAVEQGLRSVRLPGRFQRIAGRDGIEWVLDVAHNPEAAAALAASLARRPVRGRTLAVVGMLADKDLVGALVALRGQVDCWFAVTIDDGARGQLDTAVAARANEAGIAMRAAGSVAEGMQVAAHEASPGDRIVVFGSFHTVGPALACV